MKSSMNSDFALFKAVSCEAEMAVPDIVELFQSMELKQKCMSLFYVTGALSK